MSPRYGFQNLIPAISPILALSLFVLPTFVRAQPSDGPKLPTIAVMPLQAKGVSGIDADVITDAIATQLQQSGTQRVLERAQMDQILKEQGFRESGACDGPDCVLQVGKLLSVDRILVGSVGLIGHTYTLNLRLVGVTTGEVIRSNMKSHAGTIDDVLTKLVPETVSDLVGSPAAVRTRSDTGSAPAAPPTPAKVVISKSNWGWWLAGGAVVVAGGVAAAILLTKGSSSPSSDPGATGTVPAF